MAVDPVTVGGLVGLWAIRKGQRRMDGMDETIIAFAVVLSDRTL